MSSDDIKPGRDWRQIATELSKELDSEKVMRLAGELIEAFEKCDYASRLAENRSQRLLFVDDDRGIRATLPIILQQRGFNVAVASNVVEAIQKIEKYALDVLLVDLNIEQTSDRFAVVRAFRRANPGCPVIVLTAAAAFESAVEGIREKVDDYLVKPVDPELLIATLERRLMERRLKWSSRGAGQ